MLFSKLKPKPKTGRAANPDAAAGVVRAPRYDSIAFVSINGYDGMAVLRNISQSGFRMESKTFVEMELGNVFMMQITPELASGVKQFEVKVEVRWIQSDHDKFSVGFMVVEGENRSLQRYVDFLKRSSRTA
ncbi:MAG: PilZ domain-containing protein [Treponema sp.]|jgi:hypothetical protein|nr:PilZ domain-containing protein [Treponema sp.]